MAPVLYPRQVLLYDDDYGWWYSDTAIIVKWTIGAVIFAIILIYFCGGYIHAKNRLAKGLPPLGYHRWMVRRQMTPQAYPTHFEGNNGGYGNYGGYAEPYQPPPPVYNPYQNPPPSYYPDNMPPGIPMNSTKTNPDQVMPQAHQFNGVTGGEASGSNNPPRP
ncbi:hypothetical protein H072_5553 [Dactylellina haptotyla CBS 200.50]|uniref:Uncharacterized protein n=1 Tax=Dactylellina haptotyla (strain CBS 200.50) TaxID=1284197 RepID=S8AC69_DACHA|nr:hypothetical protein H072_5553 [Dactylellina haptotyla CBS 200.50]